MRMTHEAVAIPFTEPFASNRGVANEVRQSVVRLSWQGLTGLGAALAVDPGELDACAPLLADASPFARRDALARLAAAGARPAVLAGVDLALHDLLGKATDRPLHQLLGLAGAPLPPTALSLGACSDQELARRGAACRDWPILKLKLTAADDGRRVGFLRRVYPGRIWVDGNGSWEPGQALKVAEELARHGVELLEQPVPAGDVEALRTVHRHSPVPVFADEDCTGPADLARLAGAVTGINIKLTKCGGLQPALDMITLARAAGLRIMLGCKNESTLGVTAMAQLAPLADHLDLDGPLHLRDDPFRGIEIDRGSITLPPGPGLGVTPTSTRTEKN
ncbi:mandelate racemase/muconate lactonizing enzyme family protein [Kitasatospora sp. LaBMicrA B282]|uniref:mandelate racemase/muconate lactonizing enzyme family protein n=1 Tax=Kitasatospora sp. LaBMicrA B282 TaxID=3420949 RepID=UPI003D0B6098